jgi:hypothetical protein
MQGSGRGDEGPAGLDVQLGGAGHRPEQAGDEDGVVDERAGVADAEFERGRVRRRADVEVRHLGVGDDAGADQVGDEVVVLGGGCQPAVGAGRGPPLPDDRADAGVPGVDAVPVGRAGRQRQQHREVGRDPLADVDGEVPVGDADVDLGAADELLVDEHAVLLLHAAVAAGGGELEVGEAGPRGGAHGGDAEALPGGHLHHAGAEPGEFRPQVVERADDGGICFDRRPLYFGRVKLLGKS